jgi:uncharacterized integral membrane protein
MAHSQRAIYERQQFDLSTVVRLAAILLLGAAVVALVLDNRQHVRVGYVVGEATAPAWMVIVVAGIVGIVLAWLIRYRQGRSW